MYFQEISETQKQEEAEADVEADMDKDDEDIEIIEDEDMLDQVYLSIYLSRNIYLSTYSIKCPKCNISPHDTHQCAANPTNLLAL